MKMSSRVLNKNNAVAARP